MLNVVVAVLVAVPDVDHGPGQGPAFGVADAGLDEQRLAGLAGGNVGAERRVRGARDEERPEHRRLGGALGQAMIDRIDQHGGAERIGQKNELLPRRSAFVADVGQKLDARFPFLEGRLDLSDEIVQMPHERLRHRANARARRRLHALEDGRGDVVFVEITHRSLSSGEAPSLRVRRSLWILSRSQ